MDTKICQRCKQEKSVAEFGTFKGGLLQGYCKLCAALARTESRERKKTGARSSQQALMDLRNDKLARGVCYCPLCKMELPVREFNKNASSPTGLCWSCRACTSARNKIAWKEDPEKKRAYQRKAVYGLSEEGFQALFSAQGGVCAICGGPPTPKRKTLSVDHCHASGAVRGLLCGPCNAGLGNFKDSPEQLQKAIDYLRKT
jgi:hypothetical protein